MDNSQNITNPPTTPMTTPPPITSSTKPTPQPPAQSDVAQIIPPAKNGHYLSKILILALVVANIILVLYIAVMMTSNR